MWNSEHTSVRPAVKCRNGAQPAHRTRLNASFGEVEQVREDRYDFQLSPPSFHARFSLTMVMVPVAFFFSESSRSAVSLARGNPPSALRP